MSAPTFFWLALSNVIGGSSYAALAAALRGFSPAAVLFWRVVVSVVCFASVLIKVRGWLNIEKGDHLRLAVIGIFGLAAPLIMGAWGQARADATDASLLIGVEPITISLLAALWLGEHVSGRKMGALLFGLVGSLFIVCQGLPFYGGSLSARWRGDVLLASQGILWALYTVLGKPLLRRLDPTSFTAATTVWSLVPMSVLYAPELLRKGLPIVSLPALGGVLFMGVGVGFLGTWAWNRGLRDASPSSVANFIFIQPVVGVLLGVFLEKDPFTLWSAAGGALIFSGVWVAAREG